MNIADTIIHTPAERPKDKSFEEALENSGLDRFIVSPEQRKAAKDFFGFAPEKISTGASYRRYTALLSEQANQRVELYSILHDAIFDEEWKGVPYKLPVDEAKIPQMKKALEEFDKIAWKKTLAHRQNIIETDFLNV